MKRTAFSVAISAAALTLALSGCSGSSDAGDTNATANNSDGGSTATTDNPGETGFDLANVKPDSAVADLVPAKIKEAGVLLSGASTDYPPAEFRKADGQTPTGYDIDMIKAIAKVMDLKEGKTTHAEFDSLLPQVGAKFDVSASSFTITPEREAKMNMIAYAKVGFAYGVPQGNPSKFDPKDVCGKIIGVQTGTAQLEAMQELSKQCVADGKKAIELKPHKSQAEVTQKVVNGQYDATVADSPVIGYAQKQTNGKLEKIGDQFDAAMHGIVIPKDQPELTKAVQAAMQKLMDDGTLKQIFDFYGSGEIALDKAELNPKVD